MRSDINEIRLEGLVVDGPYLEQIPNSEGTMLSMAIRSTPSQGQKFGIHSVRVYGKERAEELAKRIVCRKTIVTLDGHIESWPCTVYDKDGKSMKVYKTFHIVHSIVTRPTRSGARKGPRNRQEVAGPSDQQPAASGTNQAPTPPAQAEPQVPPTTPPADDGEDVTREPVADQGGDTAEASDIGQAVEGDAAATDSGAPQGDQGTEQPTPPVQTEPSTVVPIPQVPPADGDSSGDSEEEPVADQGGDTAEAGDTGQAAEGQSVKREFKYFRVPEVNATKKAVEFAEEHDIDIDLLFEKGLVILGPRGVSLKALKDLHKAQGGSLVAPQDALRGASPPTTLPADDGEDVTREPVADQGGDTAEAGDIGQVGTTDEAGEGDGSTEPPVLDDGDDLLRAAEELGVDLTGADDGSTVPPADGDSSGDSEEEPVADQGGDTAEASDTGQQ